MTAMKTASSGYIQRKMVKIMEDLQIKYDQTVRNSVDSIVQFSYGNDNLSPRETTLIKEEPSVCDVGRLATQLNTIFERDF